MKPNRSPISVLIFIDLYTFFQKMLLRDSYVVFFTLRTWFATFDRSSLSNGIQKDDDKSGSGYPSKMSSSL